MKVVVKIGGSLMKEGVPSALVDDVAGLASAHQIVIVHGGGEVVTEYATRLGKEQKFVVSPEGIRSRYTDRETAEIYQMVMSGLLAKRLVSALDAKGLKSISLSGGDGLLLQGKRKSKLVIVDERGRKVAIEGGYTGKVVGVNSSSSTTSCHRATSRSSRPWQQERGPSPLTSTVTGRRRRSPLAQRRTQLCSSRTWTG